MMATNGRRATRRRIPKLSEQLYRRWVIEHHDDSADIVIRDGSGFKGKLEQTLPDIANAFVRYEEGRVRADGVARKKGTISLRVFDDNRRQVVNILKWAKERFGDRLKHESFAVLFTETDYEAMVMSFTKRLSASRTTASASCQPSR